MTNVRLIFGTSNSQPVGGADRDIEAVYQSSYKPLIRALYNAPQIRSTLHFSGNLLQWIEHRHSEFIDVLGEMTGRKQVEMLGGGFYNPVFSLIPRGDRLGQLERMTTYLRKHFGRRPRGVWITEGIWDPSLPALLKSSGIEYTFLDDAQFALSGCQEHSSYYGPCITEDEGKTVEVFPLADSIVDAVFDETPDEVVQRILEVATRAATELPALDEPPVVALLFRGERLGAAKGSSEQDAQWLQEFLDLLSDRRDRIETIHPGRYVKANRPHGRGYFAATPYSHISRWMKTHAEGVDNGHGFFRCMLTQYPESNLLYSKMQYIHVLVNQIRGDKYRKRLAREELWRGQNHNAYWHTPLGGIYISRLRKSVYAALIEAEKVTREKGIFIPSIVTLDFDMDGVNEYLFQGQEMNAYVHALGGTLFEFDYLPKPWNYLDTMTRYREAYHPEDEPHDRYRRSSFIDHFFENDEAMERFYRMEHRELGDFAARMYEAVAVHKEDHRLVLRRSGLVRQGSQDVAIEIHKRYFFHETRITVQYHLQNRGSVVLDTLFAPEINLALPPVEQSKPTMLVRHPDGSEQDVRNQADTLANVSGLIYRDYVNNVVVQVSAAEPVDFWILPVETSFLSSGELRREYQASCVVPLCPVHLDPGAAYETEISLELRKV